MGYIENKLVSAEKVIYRTKLHWGIFLWSAIFLVVAIIGFAGGSEPTGWLFILLTVLTGISSFINYSTSEFGVTNKRVLVKVGWIRRHSLETLLAKVEGIGVDQGILGRIFGYGTIVITGPGGTKEPFHKIDEPLEFHRRVQEQIATVQESK